MNLFTYFKKIIRISLLFIMAANVNAQPFKSAIDYIQYIDNQYRKIGEDMWSYTSAVAHGKNAKRVEARRTDLVNTTFTAKQNISKMPDFENDGSLRDSMVSYLNLCYIVLNDDYSKIIDLEEIAEQSYDLMEAYIIAQEKANEKLDEASKMINNQSKFFAEKHNIKLIETNDKLSIKLDKANKTFKYYNSLYLLFFKCYKQEAYLMDAVQKGDINAMEQNNEALITIATEGISAIDKIQAYNSDMSLKNSCRNLLSFYQSEGKNKIPLVINFFIKQENFEKIKKSFDAKSQSSRTKEDVDIYNKAIADLNKSGNLFNATTQELNNKRNNLLETWNNTIQAFFDRHVPKN